MYSFLYARPQTLRKQKKDEIFQLFKEGEIMAKWRGRNKTQIKISKYFPSIYGIRVVHNRWLKQKQIIHWQWNKIEPSSLPHINVHCLLLFLISQLIAYLQHGHCTLVMFYLETDQVLAFLVSPLKPTSVFGI